MATFGSDYDYSVTALDIVKGALRALGAIASGETPTAGEITDGLEALNQLCKQWMGGPNPIVPGLKMWLRETASLTLTAKATFALQSSGGDCDIDPPVGIIAINRKNTSDGETLLTKMTWAEYLALGNKAETGTPTRYYYELQLDAGYLYLDYIPSDTTDTLEIAYHRLVKDFDAQTDVPDYPQYWYRALKFNLAVELAPEFGKPITPELQRNADHSLLLANMVHPEEVVACFEPGRD